MKYELSITILCASALFLLLASSGLAEQDDNSTIASLYHTREEQRNPDGIELMPGVSMGILLEAEASYEKQGDASASDIVLATFEAGIDANLKDVVNGHVLLLWEEDDTEPLDVDEAFITLGNSEDQPFFVQAGKMYVPFGEYHSHFVSDSLALEIGETRETAVIIGYANDIMEISAGSFNGNIDYTNSDHVDDIVFSINLKPSDGMEFGAYWISDLGESDFIEETITANIDASMTSDIIPATEPLAYDNVAAFGAHLHVEHSDITVDSEYIRASGSFNAGLLADTESRPEVWNIELAYSISESITVAVKNECTEGCPDLPESQHGIAGAYAFADNMTFALEYLRGEFKDDIDKRDTATAQLAMEF